VLRRNQEGLQPVPQVHGCCPLTRPAAARLQAFLISSSYRHADAMVGRIENVDATNPLTS
jgi:hypothetical protein